MKTKISIAFICLIMTGISFGLKAQNNFYKSPDLLFDEDFTDGKFNDTGSGKDNQQWSMGGFAKIDEVNNREGMPKALLRDITDGTGNGWDALGHWYKKDQNGETQNILIDKRNDVVFLKFKAFSDVAGEDISPSFGVEVAMLEDKSSAPYGHDLSFEVTHVFIKKGAPSTSKQIAPNVENTFSPDIPATSKSHHNVAGGKETPQTLDTSYESQVLWRNMPDQHQTNMEIWGALNSGQFTVDTPMVSSFDPIYSEDHSVFNHVQIALFDKNKNNNESMTFRDGYKESNAQIGIAYCALGITKKSDFTLDYKINEKDADTLAKYWGETGDVTIKEGDATNDQIVNIDDANPLIGFWSDSLEKTIKASAEYFPNSGKITLDLKNISFFKITGPANAFTKADADFSGINNIMKTTDNDTVIAAYTKDEWEKNQFNLGKVASSGLQTSKLKLIVNYKGSGLPNGMMLDFDEEFLISGKKEKQKNYSTKPFTFDQQKILLNKNAKKIHVKVLNSSGKQIETLTGNVKSLNGKKLSGKGFRILHIVDQHNEHYIKKYVKF